MTLIKNSVLMLLVLMLSSCNLGHREADDTLSPIIMMTGTPRPEQPARSLLDPALASLPAFALPSETVANIQAIYESGQAIGNQAGVFSKVGDSMTVSRSFLYAFGVDNYDLAGHSYLQTIIDGYSETNTRGGTAFTADSLAAGEGWIGSSVFNPSIASPACNPNEPPLLCEYRIMRPSVAIIMFGTNDSGYRSDTQYREDIHAIVTFTENAGIIPLLTTMPNRPDVAERVLAMNEILREIASERNLPIIDLYALTINLPNYGLTFDDVHLSTPPAGLSGTATFTDANLQYGYTVRNLATLQALAVLQALIDD
ncbi:MAG: SGNH/GDSL hydrolase family protein [Chloroflexota bacterium]